MKTSEFLNEVEKELGQLPGTIKLNDQFRKMRYWDSLAEIAFLAMVEEKLGIQLSPEDMKKATLVQDLIDLLKLTE